MLPTITASLISLGSPSRLMAICVTPEKMLGGLSGERAAAEILALGFAGGAGPVGGDALVAPPEQLIGDGADERDADDDDRQCRERRRRALPHLSGQHRHQCLVREDGE